jgi:hypothetical protein
MQVENDSIENEVEAVVRECTERMLATFKKARAFQQRVRQDLGPPPAGVETLRPFAGQIAILLECVTLIDLNGNQLWPPKPMPIASFIAGAPAHRGADWWRDVEQRTADQRAEAARVNAANAERAREHEDQENAAVRARARIAERNGG